MYDLLTQRRKNAEQSFFEKAKDTELTDATLLRSLPLKNKNLCTFASLRLIFRIINNLFQEASFLWFPSQNRTVSKWKPYVFGMETVRFWDGNRKM